MTRREESKVELSKNMKLNLLIFIDNDNGLDLYHEYLIMPTY